MSIKLLVAAAMVATTTIAGMTPSWAAQPDPNYGSRTPSADEVRAHLAPVTEAKIPTKFCPPASPKYVEVGIHTFSGYVEWYNQNFGRLLGVRKSLEKLKQLNALPANWSDDTPFPIDVCVCETVSCYKLLVQSLSAFVSQ